MERRRWSPGLLARVTSIYAIGAMILSATVALSTFALVQSRLLSGSEARHRAQTYNNAIDVQNQLLGAAPFVEEGVDAATIERFEDEPISEEVGAASEADAAADAVDQVYQSVLEGLRTANGSRALIVPADGSERSLTLSLRNIPTALQAAVDPIDGLSNVEKLDIAQLRYADGESMNFAVGVRLDEIDAVYYETVPLTDIQDALASLRNVLALVAVVASIAGAGLGFYSARGALAPLARVSGAARSIAGGDFDTKLNLEADRDLAVLTQAFNGMVDAVKDRIEREQRFTSDVSHELRSPLMTLAASVEVLERRKESLPGVAQQAVDLLSHDLHRFQRLVEDLLEVSRMEAGAVQLQQSQFKLSEFLENVIFQSRTPHLELTCSDADADTVITADKRRLAQVTTNLLENAEKYGDGADGVRFEVIGKKVQIVVADRGTGVPVEQRERIFERFGRAEAGNRSAAPGFGLGLSLVAEHVRLHDGKVWVTDRIDGERGARFVVELPLADYDDGLEEMAL